MSANGAPTPGAGNGSAPDGDLASLPGERSKRSRGAFASRLTRGRLAAILLAGSALAVIVLLLAVYAPRWWGDEGGSYTPSAIVSSAQITPRSSLFGDMLTARVAVLVDPRQFDPASIQLDSTFRPYVVQSQSRRAGPRIGRAATVVFDYSIQCLTGPCIALMSQKPHSGALAKTVVFPPASLSARAADGKIVTQHVPWPTIVVHSRLSANQIALATPALDPKLTLPAVTWRIDPDLLGAVALSVAVLLGLVATWLAASIVVGDSRVLFGRFRRPPRLSAVERALLLAEHAAASGELDEERKALERLAVELRHEGRDDLAGRAERLAWSAEEPSSENVGELAGVVRADDD
jgi:hypothetical protein